MPPTRRWRGAARVAGRVGGVLGVALVGMYAVLQTPPGQRALGSAVGAALGHDVSGVLAEGWRLDVGRLHLGLGGRLALWDVALRGPDGVARVAVRQADVRLSLEGLLGSAREARVRAARIDGVTVTLRQGADGALDLLTAFGPPSAAPPEPAEPPAPWGGLPIGVRLEDVGLRDARVVLRQTGADGAVVGGFGVWVGDLRVAAHLLRDRPAVVLDDLGLRAVLLRPGPAAVQVDGAASYDGDAVRVPGLRAAVDGLVATLQGEVVALSEGGRADVAVELSPLQLAHLDGLLGAGLAGVYEGRLTARGPLAGLELGGGLAGVGDTRGTLAVDGSVLCLPIDDGGPDACAPRGTVRPPSLPLDLRWRARLDVDDLAVEQIFPPLGGPLVLNGVVEAQGGGTSWPDGLAIERGRLDLRDADVFGVPLRSVAGDVTLRNGVIAVDNADVTALVGTARGRVTFDLQTGALEVDAGGPLTPAMLADLGVDGLGGEGVFHAVVTGQTYAPGAPIGFQGDLDLAGARYGPDVVADRLWGSFRGRVEAGITDVAVDARATGLTAYGARLPEVALPDLAVHVAESVTVTGRATAPFARYGEDMLPAGQGAQAPALAELSDVVAAFEVAVPAAAPLTVHVDVDTGPHALASFRGDAGRVVVDLVGDGLAVDVALTRAGERFVDLPALRFDLAEGRLALASAGARGPGVLALAPDLAITVREPAALTLAEGGVADMTLSVTGDLGELDADALTVGTTGPLTGRLSLARLDLSMLSSLLDRVTPALVPALSGRVDTVTLAAAGSAESPSVDLDLAVSGVGVDGVVAGLDGVVGAALRPGQLAVDGRLGSAGTALLVLDAALPMEGGLTAPAVAAQGAVRAEVRVTPGPLSRVAALMPGLSLPEGALSAALEVRGDLSDPQFSLGTVAELPLAGLDAPARVEATVRREGTRLRVVADALEGFSSRARLHGTAETRLDDVVRYVTGHWPVTADPLDLTDPATYADALGLTLDLRALPLQTVAALASVQGTAAGHLSGSLGVRGAVLAPTLFAAVGLDGAIAGEAVDGHVCLVGEEEAPTPDPCAVARSRRAPGAGYALDLDLGHGDDRWLTAAGPLPLDVDLRRADGVVQLEGLDLTVGGAGVPLALARLADPALEVTEGRVQLAGAVRGGITRLEPDLTVVVERLRGTYAPLGIELRGLGGERGGVGAGAAPQRVLDARVLVDGEAAADEPLPLRIKLDGLAVGTWPAGGQLRGLVPSPSTVTAKGALKADSGGLGGLRFDVELRNAWLLATDAAVLRASGAAEVVGLWPELLVRGDVAVDRARVLLNTTDLLADRAIAVSPKLVIHRQPTRTRREEEEQAAEEPGVADLLDLDLSVDLGRSAAARILVPVLEDLGAVGASVTRAQVDARLAGSLDVDMRDGELSLVGEVGTVEGSVKLLQSTFQLSADSSVTFLGADYANPRLDIRGGMALSDGAFNIEIGGTALSPTLSLSSDTLSGSDVELFTVLLTGRSPDDLSADQGTAALQAVGDLLLDSVLGGINLGSVSVEADGSVTIGFPISRALLLESRFDPTPQLNQNRILVTAELSPIPRLLFEAAYGDRLIYGNAYYELRFEDVWRTPVRNEGPLLLESLDAPRLRAMPAADGKSADALESAPDEAEPASAKPDEDPPAAPSDP